MSNDSSHNTANTSTPLPPSSFLNFLPHSFLMFFFPSRREHWKLLSSLKTTVEGLVSTNNPNVWSRYGGLQRLHKDMNNILSNGLKNEQVRRSDWYHSLFCNDLFLFVKSVNKVDYFQTYFQCALCWALTDLQVKVSICETLTCDFAWSTNRNNVVLMLFVIEDYWF